MISSGSIQCTVKIDSMCYCRCSLLAGDKMNKLLHVLQWCPRSSHGSSMHAACSTKWGILVSLPSRISRGLRKLVAVSTSAIFAVLRDTSGYHASRDSVQSQNWLARQDEILSSSCKGSIAARKSSIAARNTLSTTKSPRTSLEQSLRSGKRRRLSCFWNV